MFKIDLRKLVVLLAFISSLATLIYILFGTYQAERGLLIENTLEGNHAYALKLARSTDDFLNNLQQQLSYSAQELADNMDKRPVLDAEAKRLKQQNNSFNSVLIANHKGRVLSTSPPDLGLTGSTLDSVGASQALSLKRALISPPYMAQTGRLLVFISHPIVDTKGHYLGYVGGSIYLHEPNSLNMLLGEHYYNDGSQIYVVDQARRLIYHQDRARIGDTITHNQAVEQVILGQDGKIIVANSAGTSMLAGYAATQTYVGWGIVVQRPSHTVLNDLDTLLKRIVNKAIPFFLVITLLIWWLGRLIALPLWQLARTAPNLDSSSTEDNVRAVRAWYFESEQIKKALLVGLQRLSKKIGRMDMERNTDPLTGLLNRRGLEGALQDWQKEGQHFTVLACDIDHFKMVNDTHGHDVGDLVLQFLADTMRAQTRQQDLVCRAGGEEFLIFLPHTLPDEAYGMAERMRMTIAQTDSPSGAAITISIGLAHWPTHGQPLAQVLKAADQALYTAKHQGRNRTEVAPIAQTDESAHT